MAITYKNQTRPDTNRAKIAVYLHGRLAGHIRGTFDGGFAYTPKGSRVSGDTFRSLEDCKASVEGEG